MKKKQHRKPVPVKKSNSLKEQLSRYKFAERNKDITLTKKTSLGVFMELNGKSKKGSVLLEQSLESYFSQYLDDDPSPFISKRPVTGSNLLDRQKEMEWTLKQIQNQSLVLLYGASGFGKTSLAIALQEQLKNNNDLVVGYVSFNEATSEWDLVKRYVEAMYRAMGVPDYRWGSIGESNFNAQLLENYYDMPTAFAKKLGKKLIAIVDDFNAVYELPHAQVIEAKFRATWQADAENQKHISAIVFQSITLARLKLTSRRRAMEETGVVYYFERISSELWVSEIKKRFDIGHKSIDKSVIQYIIERMNHNPRRVQNLCHHLFTNKSKVVTKRLIDKTIEHLIGKVSWIYEARLGFLTKLEQAALYSFADKSELNIPPTKRFQTFSSLDEFVYYYGGEMIFRDPFLETYILKRNNINQKLLATRWEKLKKSGESGTGKNFDDKEWTWG